MVYTPPPPPSWTPQDRGWAIPPPPPPWQPPPAAAAPAGRNTWFRAAAAIAAGVIIGAAITVPIVLATRGHSTVAGSSSPPASAASGGGEAATLYREAIAAMRASAGFHYVAVSGTGQGTQRIVGDAGQNGGTQAITVGSSFGPEQFTLVLAHSVVYFQGNAAALQDQLGVSAAKAATMQNTWVAVSSGDGPYSVVEPGITVASQADTTTLDPTSTQQVTTSGGVHATRISGDVPPDQGAPGGTGHLDISPSTHLPIAYLSTVSFGGTDLNATVSFSGWGTAPSASAPASSVAWSTLGATEPPGGFGGGGANLGPSAPGNGL